MIFMGRKSVLIPAVQKIIGEYNIGLTIRQVFYRLVSAGIIRNTLSQYNTLDQQLTKARWDGRIPFSTFEDRVRSFEGGEPFYFREVNKIFEDTRTEYETAEETFKDSYGIFNLPYWHNQPIYVEVWLEKDALTGLFQQITDRRHVRLAPCRGYPSVSFLYEAAMHLRTVPEEKEIVILYFGDYDMRGLDIQRHITETLARLGFYHITVKRCALTKQQIQEYNLPPQPSKKTDSMASGWIETHGDVAWELDALDPNELMKTIDSVIEQHFDYEIWNKRCFEVGDGQKQLKKMIAKYLGESEDGGD